GRRRPRAGPGGAKEEPRPPGGRQSPGRRATDCSAHDLFGLRTWLSNMATMPVESLYKIDHFASCVSVLCAQSGWKRARAGTVVEVEVTGRLVMNDLATKLTALLAS